MPHSQIWLHAVGSTESRQVLADNSKAEIVDPLAGSRIGALLFTRGGTLMSQPFDMERLAAVGEPMLIAHEVTSSANRAGLAAASRQAVLAYVSGPRAAGNTYGAIARADIWVPRAVPALWCAFRPDGKRLVGDLDSTRVLDLATGIATDLLAIRAASSCHPCSIGFEFLQRRFRLCAEIVFT